MDSITQLRSLGLVLAKRWSIDPNGFPIGAGYDKAKHFAVVEHPVSCVEDLAQVLDRTSPDPFSCVIRGRPGPSCDIRRTARLGILFENVSRHWSMHDFDAVDCPDWLDWRAEPAAAADFLRSLLPPQFHEATCWWSFTGSQGFKPGLRMRLAFWHDVAISGADLKLWLCEREPSPGKPKKSWPQVCPVDGSIYGHVQPIYVAKPVLAAGVVDPVPQRTGILRGRVDVVPTPVPITARFTASIETPGPGPSALTDRNYEGSGYAYHRSRIGDDADGFHLPLRAALAAWIAMYGAETDPTPAIEDLSSVAWAVCPADPVRRGDVDERIAALPRVAEWIRDRQRETERRLGSVGASCHASHPLPTLTLAEAQFDLDAAARTAFLRTRSFFAVQRDPEAADGSDRHKVGACGRGAAALFDGPARVAICAGVGVGKTEAVIRQIVSLIDDRPKTRIAFAAPTHKTADDICGRLNAAAGEVVAKVWRGANFIASDQNAVAMCRVPALVARVQQAGGGIRDVCGGPKRGWCRHHPARPEIVAEDACAYRRQADARIAVWIVQHAMLTSAPPPELPAFDMLVIDEAPWLSSFGGLTSPVRIPLPELVRPRILGGPEGVHTLLYRSTAAMLARALEGQVGLFKRAALLDAGVTGWRARTCASQIWSAKSKLPIHRNLPEQDAIAAIDRVALGVAPVATLARAWTLLADFLESGEDVAPWTLEVTQDEAGARHLRLRWREPFPDGWIAGPVICLDATPEAEVSRLWLPDLTILTNARAREVAVHRVQVVDRQNGKTSWLGTNEELAGERTAKLRSLRRFIEIQAFRHRGRGSNGGPDIAVVTYKGLAQKLSVDAPSNVAVGNFNALRGFDGWSGVAAIIVIGRPLPAPRDVAIMASVGSGKLGAYSTETYERDVPGAITMRDGTGRRVQTLAHPDPLADAFRRQVLTEVEQAEGRARGVRRSKASPLLSYVLTAQPTALVVDEALTQSYVLDDIDLVALLAARGIVPNNATDAGSVLGEEVGEAAQRADNVRKRLSRSGQSGILERLVTGTGPERRESVTGPNDIYYQDRSHFRGDTCELGPEAFKTFRCYRYRRRDCRKSGIALVDIQTHRIPRAALAVAFGELVFCERVSAPAWLVDAKAAPVWQHPERMLKRVPSVVETILGTDHRVPTVAPAFLPVAMDVLSIRWQRRLVTLHVYAAASGVPLLLMQRPNASWPPRRTTDLPIALSRASTTPADHVFTLADVTAAVALPLPRVRPLMDLSEAMQRAAEVGLNRAGIKAVERLAGPERFRTAIAQLVECDDDSSGKAR